MDRHERHNSATIIAACALFALVTVGTLQAPDPQTPKSLHAAAKERYDRVGSYIARLTRRETVKGERRPEEVILLMFREKPWSIHAKWLGEEGRGREGIYVKGQHDSKVHVRLAAGDVLFMPAGRRMALSPDGALLRAASTHTIAELGI